MRRFIVLSVLALTACTPDAYRKSADDDVARLVRDRERKTIDYTPKVDAAVTTKAEPTRRSYDKLPMTAVPTTAPAEIAPATFEPGAEPLGPQMLFAPGTDSPSRQPLSIEEAREPAIARLRLGPVQNASRDQTFDLFHSVRYAVNHSRDYQSQMEDVYLSALDVTLQRHLFSPRPFARTGARFTGSQVDAGYASALTITNSVGVRQRLPYGGEIVAEGLVDFVNALNDNVSDGENAQLALSGTIPLLRGAGMVNLENLIDSEREMVYRIRQFEEFRRSFAVNVATQYFLLLTRQQSIANRRFNYVVLSQLTEQTQALYAAGRINFLQVQRALQAQYSAENSLILAINDYQSSLDQFKIIIGLPVEEPLEVVAVELDVTPPDTNGDVTKLALQYRLDLQTASDRIEDARRGVSNSKNGLLPDLDLAARGAVGNRDDTPAKSIDSRNLDYSAGVTLDLPIDRVAERNTYRRSLISLERAQRNFQETRDRVIAQVRESVQSIRSAEATLDIQRRNIDLNRRRLDFATELLVLGRATDSRDVVDAQNALLSAQDAYERARADYQIQILQFLRDTGTLRINPQAGSLGLAMDRTSTIPIE